MAANSKRYVWYAQTNTSYSNSVFLPYSSGLLHAYAMSIPEIKDNYELGEFIYLRESPELVVDRMIAKPPDVFAVSCYIWNNNHSHALAKAVKETFPNCLIVMGGPHVPNRSENFFKKHPYVDILVHGEGEEAFAEILQTRLEEYPDYGKIPGLTIQSFANYMLRPVEGAYNWAAYKTPKRDRPSDIDKFPSPYLTGVFDHLIEKECARDWHPSQETHRGCPFSCTFCDWGSSVFQKVRRFSDERIKNEIDYFSEKRLGLLYNCDANFAMFERDVELTKYMVQKKKETGYPEKFRAAYAKNSGERVFTVSKMLNEAGMSKGATLSFQSMDDNTLQVIKRKNIGIETYKQLMKKYRAESIPTYSEIIIGLAGESYPSFADGLDLLLNSGAHDSITVYICELLPNSEMSDPAYVEKHGIKSSEIPVLFFHGTPTEDPYQEMYEIVTSTNTLPPNGWLSCCLLANAVQMFHCIGLTQKVAVFCKAHKNTSYRAFYEGLIDYAYQRPETLLGGVFRGIEGLFRGIPEGKPWGIVDQRFGNIIWPPEEGGFLKYVADCDRFYADIYPFMERQIGDPKLAWNVWHYQKSMLLKPDSNKVGEKICLDYNIHAYIESAYKDEPIELQPRRVNYWLRPDKEYKDLEEYAREAVWFNRKSSTGNFCKVSGV